MPYEFIIWDLEDETTGNVEHIGEHEVSRDEVEDVLRSADSIRDTSRSSNRPAMFGWTRTGRYIFVVYEEIDADTARPITAFEVDPP